MKKILLLFTLAFAIVNANAQTISYNEIWYEVTSSSTVKVASNSNFVGVAIIPDYFIYEDVTYYVTEIGLSAFNNCSGLTEIIIPNSVTAIGDIAFWSCSGLKSANIPYTVTSIGLNAFANCINLNSITNNSYEPLSIDANVFEGINENAALFVPVGSESSYRTADGWKKFTKIVPYIGTAITEGGINYKVISDTTVEVSTNAGISGDVTIPNTITFNGAEFKISSISNNAFNNCTGMKSITLPNSLTSIGSNAFNNCTNIKAVTIPNSVTNIGSNAFAYCTGLISVNISNSLKSIGLETFYHCISLTSVIIPNSVTSIANSAFYECTALKTVTIPKSLTTFGFGIFYYCSNLQFVTVNWESPITINSAVFQINPSSPITLYVPVGSEASYKVASVWKDFNVQPIQSVSLENINYTFTSATTVSVGKSPNATGVVIIPKSIVINGKTYQVSGVADSAFYGNQNITKLIFSTTTSQARSTGVDSSEVETIGKHAFEGCIGLTIIEIPNSVTSIGDSAFAFCTDLEEVIVNWEIPLAIQENVFEGVQISVVTLSVPFGTELDYKSAPVWKNFAIITGIDVEEKMQFSIYPNPISVNKELSLSSVVAYYSLLNAAGVEVANGNNTDKVSTFGLAKGLYILKSENQSIKLIVE